MGITIWKGNIHFGDVNVPVRLHTALKEERIQFHLLHKRDYVKLRQQMVCAYEKKPAPLEEQAKGFEVEAPEIEEEGEGPAALVAALEESMRKMKKNR